MHSSIVKLHVAVAVLELLHRVLVTHVDVIILALAVAVVRQDHNVAVLELDEYKKTVDPADLMRSKKPASESAF